ncbi:MAG TPA: cbb3-type cytochrome c oxidase subunit I [Gammaproteobacteria bacterium]|nr:cbb3-type cytochrome c oxidase subunit I [Gammaproteobacteria bacterium]
MADSASAGTRPPDEAALASDPTIRALKWALVITLVVTVGILIYGTFATYRMAPKKPDRFVTADGTTVMTGGDIVEGQAAFQKADLMDYGSLYGMGSYYGEDYTATYLKSLGREVNDVLARQQTGKAFADLSAARQYEIRGKMQRMLQGLVLEGHNAVLPAPVATAVRHLKARTVKEVRSNNFAAGWTRAQSLTPAEADKLADFLIYSAFTTVAHRPGTDYSYTNNWPYEPSVGNTPTTGTFVWTWVSIAWVLFGTGVVIYIFYRFIHREDGDPKEVLLKGFPTLTESQRKTGKYFLTVAALFLLQIAAGSLMAHDYSDRVYFYGLNLNTLLPFPFLRSLHTQLPILWIGLAWIGAGLFLGPFIGGREPRHQGLLVDLLYVATVVVAVGGLFGDYAGIKGWFHGHSWFWFGNQGLAYLELGRAFQIGLFAGLAIWSVLVGRAMWPALKARKGWLSVEHLVLYSTINIAVLYVFGMIPIHWINSSFTIADFWRWWVVHLWVEQAFELFVVAITGYLLMAMGLVSRRLTLLAILFEVVLIFLGGDDGVGHHMYWVGEPGMWIPIGSLFSYIEVLPLVLLVVDSLIEQRRLIQSQPHFPHRVAYLYILGSAFWNFMGAGVFGGGLINTPLVNYYEHGTFLTLGHAHTALFGAFGLIAIGLVYFVLRYFVGERRWSDAPGVWAFWLFNAGLGLWLVLNFWPVGFEQLAAVYDHGYAYARSLAFYNSTELWQWLRMPGDIVFAAGAVLMAADFVVKLGPQWVRSRGYQGAAGALGAESAR